MQARLPFSRLIHPFDLRMTISIQRTFERTIWTRHTVTCEYCESHKLNSQWIKIKWGCLGGLACHGKRLWTMSAGSTFSRGPGDLFIDSFHCLTGCWCKTFWLNVALRTPTGPTMMARTSKDIQTLTLLMLDGDMHWSQHIPTTLLIFISDSLRNGCKREWMHTCPMSPFPNVAFVSYSLYVLCSKTPQQSTKYCF